MSPDLAGWLCFQILKVSKESWDDQKTGINWGNKWYTAEKEMQVGALSSSSADSLRVFQLYNLIREVSKLMC